ncbi:protein of unknown function [Microbacterium sp. Nx66]|nr:protein of unknown function [Microbacterium sp. Nx66]
MRMIQNHRPGPGAVKPSGAGVVLGSVGHVTSQRFSRANRLTQWADFQHIRNARVDVRSFGPLHASEAVIGPQPIG